MADVKISELPALTSPDGAEELVVNDGGTTKKITIDNLFNQDIDVTGTVTADCLGIGTSSPDALVSVQRPSGTQGIAGGFSLKGQDGTTQGGLGTDGVNDNYIQILAAQGVKFHTGNTNGTANERMRITAAGTLLVGTATSSLYNQSSQEGVAIQPDNVQIARSSDVALFTNRFGTDGEVIRIGKNGATVGSIGTLGGKLHIGNGNANLLFANATDDVTPASGTGSTNDASINLGAVGNRFKDLYLSGGVYLGGTGASNKLSDYETGTFTPYIGTWTGTAPTTTAGTFKGSYTKIGRSVTCQIDIDNLSLSGTTSGLFVIKGLPFTPRFAVDQSGSIGAIHRFNFARNDHKGIQFIGTVGLAILSSTNNSGWDWELNSSVMGYSYINCSITYFTDS